MISSDRSGEAGSLSTLPTGDDINISRQEVRVQNHIIQSDTALFVSGADAKFKISVLKPRSDAVESDSKDG